jgi:hypothetical protein
MGNTKEYNKEYYEKNKNKYAEHNKKYRKNNKEYFKKYGKKYREKNKEYYENYYENNKEKYSEYMKDRSEQNKTEFNLTASIWNIMTKWSKYLNKNSNICNTIDFKTFYLIRKLNDIKLIRSICVRLGKGSMTAEEVNDILNEYKIKFTMEDYDLFKRCHLLGSLATNPKDESLLTLV